MQPGKYDDNRVEMNYIGKLLRSHLGPAGDCAIASLNGRRFSNEILELGISVARIGEPHLKDRDRHKRQDDRHDSRIVSQLEVNTKMVYPGGKTATVGGFEIEPDPKKPALSNEISRGGDSGSAWMAIDTKGKISRHHIGIAFRR